MSPPVPFSSDISLGTANTVPAHVFHIPVKECVGQAQNKLDCHLTQQYSYATVSYNSTPMAQGPSSNVQCTQFMNKQPTNPKHSLPSFFKSFMPCINKQFTQQNQQMHC